MIDWKGKLTSRKFWMAVIGLVTGIMLAFKVDAQTVETVSGVIMAGASVIAYIIGEGLIDAAGTANNSHVIGFADWNPEDFEKKEDDSEDVETVQS